MSIFTTISPNSIKESTYIYDKIDGYEENQIVYCIGRYSYICYSEIDCSTGFTIQDGRAGHNLQIGQFCSIATGVRFITGRSHNYKRVSTGVCDLMDTDKMDGYFNGFCRKESIIIQNDVWIGRNSTIMPGIIIRNGAVIAANSHVVHDVPPYAIVGGNPARILGYRFSHSIISMLQKIKWWNWTEEKITENAQCFLLDIEKFCSHFYNDDEESFDGFVDEKSNNQYLYIMDFDDLYPCYPYLIDQFINKFINTDEKKVLLLYIPIDEKEKWKHKIQEVEILIKKLNSIPNINLSIELKMDVENPIKLLAQSEYYITNRRKETVLLTEYADEYNTKIISGVENNVFETNIGFN